MSDFDKEAERERLREQYEREQQKREATEKMSDLLLKGATMTNAHCDNCGDPIFRYEGREFCPTCEQVVAENSQQNQQSQGQGQPQPQGQGQTQEQGQSRAGTSAGADESGDDGDTARADSAADDAEETQVGADGTPDHIEMKRPTGPRATTADAAERANQQATPQHGAESDSEPTAHHRSQQPAGGQSEGQGPPQGQGQPQQPQQTQQPQQPKQTKQPQQPVRGSSGTGDASLSNARAVLVRTLHTQARRAETCEDPRAARDHLQAAREAAETLAALSSD